MRKRRNINTQPSSQNTNADFDQSGIDYTKLTIDDAIQL